MRKDYSLVAKEVGKEYESHPNLIGILWIGSSSFGITDRFADIDIRLLIDKSNKQFPMQQFVRHGINIEVDEISWDWLMKNHAIDSEERWIREKGVVLYDPHKRIAKRYTFLKRKMRVSTNRQLWEEFKDIFYSNDIENCLRRDDIVTSTLYLNRGIEKMLKFIFLFNEKPVPPFKWRWYFVRQDKILPSKITDLMEDIIKTSDSINNKLEKLISIEREFQKLMIAKGFPKEQVMEHWRF